jgi:hypothetical protein
LIADRRTWRRPFDFVSYITQMLKQVFPVCGDRHIELSTAGFHAPTKTIPLLKSSDVFFS